MSERAGDQVDGAAGDEAPGGGEAIDRLRAVLGWAWEWTRTLAVALVVFLFVRTYVVEAFQIPTASMEGTLLVGDFLLVNKAVYGAELPGIRLDLPAFDEPTRGDVVVFEPPVRAAQPPETRYVKRVAGVPGDILSMRDGGLYVDGEPVAEPYARHGGETDDLFSVRFLWQRTHLVREGRSREPYRPTRDDWGPIRVPADEFFVMGDNRDNSEDSRYWGFVPREAIVGRPLVVYYSYDRHEGSSMAWITDVRWGRILSPIH